MAPLFGSLFSEEVPVFRESRKITIYRDSKPPLNLDIKYPLTARELAEMIASEFQIPNEWPQFYFEGEHIGPNVCLFFFVCAFVFLRVFVCFCGC